MSDGLFVCDKTRDAAIIAVAKACMERKMAMPSARVIGDYLGHSAEAIKSVVDRLKRDGVITTRRVLLAKKRGNRLMVTEVWDEE